MEIGTAVCLFCNQADKKENLCPAGEKHSSALVPNVEHVTKLTQTWKNMALQLGELDIHSKLSIGDVRSNELYYHKLHLTQFHNRYQAFLNGS